MKPTISRKAKRLLTITGLSLAISGCASLTPPERPDYTGQDVISAVDASQLVGTWITRELNPYPGESAEQEITIEYLADGSLRGLMIPKVERSDILGETAFEMTGSWQLNGDIVTHSNIEVNSTSDNAMGAMISKMLNNSARGISGSANVYELTADRIVMVGEDGAAIEYLRQ